MVQRKREEMRKEPKRKNIIDLGIETKIKHASRGAGGPRLKRNEEYQSAFVK